MSLPTTILTGLLLTAASPNLGPRWAETCCGHITDHPGLAVAGVSTHVGRDHLPEGEVAGDVFSAPKGSAPMNPVFPWPGGKRRLAKEILPRLAPHTLYAEPFGGGLAVLLAKEPSKIEAVNDLDSDLITFFRVVRFHHEAFLDEVALVLNSREEFGDFRAQPGLTDVQRAARWYTVQRLSFGGKGKHYGKSKKAGGSAYASRERRLAAVEALSGRLDRVNVEHLDWRAFLDQYDCDTTCFFVDPPYHEGMQYDVNPWKEADHIELADRLLQLEGGWVLTYDGTPFIRELYAGCLIEEFPRKVAIGNRHGKPLRTMEEVIIRPEGQAVNEVAT